MTHAVFDSERGSVTQQYITPHVTCVGKVTCTVWVLNQTGAAVFGLSRPLDGHRDGHREERPVQDTYWWSLLKIEQVSCMWYTYHEVFIQLMQVTHIYDVRVKLSYGAFMSHSSPQ